MSRSTSRSTATRIPCTQLPRHLLQAFTVARAKLRPLTTGTDLAHALAASLTPAQRRLAVTGARRGALRLGPGRDGVVPEPRRHPRQTAERGAEGEAPRLGLAVVRTHAAGACAAAGIDVSWAIQGPSVVIEYANDARGRRRCRQSRGPCAHNLPASGSRPWRRAPRSPPFLPIGGMRGPAAVRSVRQSPRPRPPRARCDDPIPACGIPRHLHPDGLGGRRGQERP